jgi:hypothetical protein
MNKRELKRIYRELQEKMEELESAIYSDADSYSSLNVDYQDVLDYYQTNDNNSEEGL